MRGDSAGAIKSVEPQASARSWRRGCPPSRI